MKQVIKCPKCQSEKARPLRRMWRKDAKDQPVEGKQYRCQDCKTYFVVYP